SGVPRLGDINRSAWVLFRALDSGYPGGFALLVGPQRQYESGDPKDCSICAVSSLCVGASSYTVRIPGLAGRVAGATRRDASPNRPRLGRLPASAQPCTGEVVSAGCRTCVQAHCWARTDPLTSRESAPE